MTIEAIPIKRPRIPNEYASFWYCDMYVNAIPFDTINKLSLIGEYADFLHDRIMTTEEFKQYQEEGKYDNGIVIPAGKILRGKYKDYYLIEFDCDNLKAIEELCNILGCPSLEELSKVMIVEQHEDDLTKCHVICVSKHLIDKKSAYTVENDNIPNLEIKVNGPLFVSDSPHYKNGVRREFLQGCTLEPTVIKENLEPRLNSMYKKYGIPYLEKDVGPASTTDADH